MCSIVVLLSLSEITRWLCDVPESLAATSSVYRLATDLCWYCQRGVMKLARSANLPDAEKSAAVCEYEDSLASNEGPLYVWCAKLRRMTCPTDRSTSNVPGSVVCWVLHVKRFQRKSTSYTKKGPTSVPRSVVCWVLRVKRFQSKSTSYSRKGANKSPRKCSLLGVTCEAYPKQFNFLLQERGQQESQEV